MTLSPAFLRSILEAQEPDDRGLYMQVDESGGRPRRMFMCSLGQLKELVRGAIAAADPVEEEAFMHRQRGARCAYPECGGECKECPPPRPAPQPAREA